MKAIKLIVVLFSILAAFACNNQHNKKSEEKTPPITKRTGQKPVIKKTDKTEQKQFKPCEILITEILKTSPRYKQLTKGLYKAVIKNGGQSFGVSLEASPNPRQDKAWSYSSTYDFTVYEMYTDRQLNIARFSFNPGKKQLYEYDAVNDRLRPIEFDRNLLLKFNTLCN